LENETPTASSSSPASILPLKRPATEPADYTKDKQHQQKKLTSWIAKDGDGSGGGTVRLVGDEEGNKREAKGDKESITDIKKVSTSNFYGEGTTVTAVASESSKNERFNDMSADPMEDLNGGFEY
jgi:hypothetical protein